MPSNLDTASKLGAAVVEIKRLKQSLKNADELISQKIVEIIVLKREIAEHEKRELWLANRIVTLEAGCCGQA